MSEQTRESAKLEGRELPADYRRTPQVQRLLQEAFDRMGFTETYEKQRCPHHDVH